MHYNLFKHARNKKDAIFPIIHPFQKRLENMQGRDKKKEITPRNKRVSKVNFGRNSQYLKLNRGD